MTWGRSNVRWFVRATSWVVSANQTLEGGNRVELNGGSTHLTHLASQHKKGRSCWRCIEGCPIFFVKVHVKEEHSSGKCRKFLNLVACFFKFQNGIRRIWKTQRQNAGGETEHWSFIDLNLRAEGCSKVVAVGIVSMFHRGKLMIFNVPIVRFHPIQFVRVSLHLQVCMSHV